ncbi:MAG TPA: alpha/beta fold hydrolase [Burkholderiales bacterium]
MRLGAALLCAGLACEAHAVALAPGDHRFTVAAGGMERSYIVHVPPAPAGSAVVINFHGGGGEAESHQKYVRMDALADREGFITVYPYGTGASKTRLLTWNAGTCCGSAARNKVNDVGFVAALLDDLALRTPYDQGRVYATGLSNGAMMVYRLAAELPERIAAIAPVAGMMAPETFKAVRPVPIVHIHSVDDPRALYQGGLGPPFPFTSARVMHLPVEETMSKWIGFEGCGRRPVEGERREWRTRAGMHTATRIAFSGCRGGAEVLLWKLTGAGHVWPGGTRDYLTRWLGPSTMVIDANEEIWRFFVRFAIPQPGP